MNDLDFETDQSILDNLEAITYTSVRTAGNETVSITDATFDWTGGIGDGGNSRGIYVHRDGVFTIRQSLLTSVDGAKPGDTITRADGGVWTVLRVNPPDIEGIYRIDARDLELETELRQTGTLSRPSNAQSSAGRQTFATYSTVSANIPCRVQPEDVAATDAMGRRTILRRFTAILGTQVTAKAKDRFVCDGVTYTVVGFTQPDRLDEYMRLTLELVS